MLRTVDVTRYITPLREGSSLASTFEHLFTTLVDGPDSSKEPTTDGT